MTKNNVHEIIKYLFLDITIQICMFKLSYILHAHKIMQCKNINYIVKS